MTTLQRCIAISLALFPIAIVAQSTANLSGTVTDPSGAVVPHAHVKAHSLGTGADREVDTDNAGLYAIPSLQPGDYSVQAKAPGFGAYTVGKVTLNVDQTVTVNMQLPIESAGVTVQVESVATQIETQTITVGQVIDRDTVQDIPLNGRHFLDLTVLTPGGVVAPTAGNLTSTSRGLGANSFITAGNREDTVNFQINGINLNDMSQNQITFQPSINTTSEFKINNSTFSAEYGRSSGSIVNVATRSGTNKFHGEVFDYFRNEALDARNYFNRSVSPSTGLPLGVTGTKAPLKRNNFGVAVGGPVWRDKTFFFFSYEGLRQHQGILQNSTVLSSAQRAATIAAGKPAANALLAIIPVANSGNNYVAFTPGPVQIDQYTGDVLQHFSANDQLHAFYAFQKDVRTEPTLQGDTVPGFGDHRNAHRQVLTFNETHIFSPSFVNEARLGFNRISIAFNPNFTPNPTSFNIGDGVTTSLGIPQITIQDIALVFGGPSGFPQGRFDTLGVFSDTATVLRGKHTMKFGGEFRRFLEASFAGDTGTLTYASTANNFEQDTATGFSIQPTTITSRLYTNALGVFAQDNYKINANLTVEAGLRFEWNGTPNEGANRFVIFDPNSVSLKRVGTNGVGSIYNQNYNVEPRVGFVVDLFGNGHSVVRGGYGYLVDQPTETAVTGLTTNPPFSTSVSYASTSAPIPVGSLYASAKAAGIAVANVNPKFRNSYTQTFNLNLQQALLGGMVGSVGYYGSVGRHLRVRTNQNQPINGGARPYTVLSATSPIDPGASINSNIAEANSVGTSNYNALWLTLSKNMAHGLEFNTNYEWAKSMDLNSLGSQGAYVLQDSYNPGNNYGLSDFDVRHHYAGTAIYNLPFSRNRLVSGFQLSTIIQYQTGNPINILASSSTYTGVTAVVRPNQLSKPNVSKQQVAGLTNVTFIQNPGGLGYGGSVCDLTNTTPACIYRLAATQTLISTPTTACPNPGAVNPATAAVTSPCVALIYTGIGNTQRNSVIGPGFADLDLSLEKNTKMFENLSFKLRIDAFDMLNHPNFGQPSGNVQSATFGQISSTRFATSDGGSSRQLQISGKFTF